MDEISVFDFFNVAELGRGWCHPGGCMPCKGCGSQIDEQLQAAQQNRDPGIFASQYRPDLAPREVASILYESWHAAYWTGGKLDTPTVITYSFGKEHSGYTDGRINGWHFTGTGQWEPIAEDFRQLIRIASEIASRTSGVQLIEVDDPNAATIVWRAETFVQDSGLGVPELPGPNKYNADIWLNMKNRGYYDATDFRPGTEGFVFILHEIGHVLGLKHLGEGIGFMMPELNHRGNTVMSHWNNPTGQVLIDYTWIDKAGYTYIYGSYEKKMSQPVQWAQMKGGGLISTGDGSNNVVTGIEERDWMSAGAGADTLNGRGGHDTLDGDFGSDVINGGGGVDSLAVYARRGAGALQLQQEADPSEAGAFRGAMRIGSEVDTFTGIERLKFLDGTLDLRNGSFEASRSAQAVDRLTKLFYGRDANEAELRIGMDFLERDARPLIDAARAILCTSGLPGGAAPASDVAHVYWTAFQGPGAGQFMSAWLNARAGGVESLARFGTDLADSSVVKAAFGHIIDGSASSGVGQRMMMGNPVVGLDGNPNMWGSEGSDHFLSFGGNRVAHGGGGHDVLYVDANAWGGGWAGDWRLDGTSDGGITGWIQTGASRVEFSDIEEIRFLDASLHYGVTNAAGAIYRLYKGFLNRAPNEQELGDALRRVDSREARIQDIAEDIIFTQEFANQWGPASADRWEWIIRQFYDRFVGLAPNGAEISGWKTILEYNGYAQFGWMATNGATAWSHTIEMSREALNAGQWSYDAGMAGMNELFRFITTRDLLPTERAHSLLLTDGQGYGARELASHYIAQAGMSGFSNWDFANHMLWRVRGEQASAEVVWRMANMLDTGAMDRPGLALTLFNDAQMVARAAAGGTPVSFGDGPDLVWGTGGADLLYSAGGADVVYAEAGDDVVYGAWGNDLIYGQEGDDNLQGEAGNDVLLGGEGNDFLSGGDGEDRLHGEAWNDTLIGGSGDDFLDGGAGNDVILGGEGFDIALLAGARRQTNLKLEADGSWTATGPDGQDKLQGVDIIQFTDGRVYLEASNSIPAQVARLYQTLLGREADPIGLARAVQAVEVGAATVNGLAASLASSGEFQAKYGGLSGLTLLRKLYENATGQELAPGAEPPLTNLSGADVGSVALAIANRQEAIARFATSPDNSFWVADPEAAEIATLYRVVLGRLPDVGGLLHWSATREAGMSSRDAMTYFMESQEFQLRFGAPDAEGFVNLLYQNLLERDADPIGMEHWRGGLESGAFQRVDVVNGFAYSDEMTARLAADVRDGILFG